MTIPESRYTLARDVPDPRDYVYTLERRLLRAPLPKRVDLRPGCPQVFNQGGIGTCTAHAVAAAVAYERRLQGTRAMVPSRLFIYYNERMLTGQRSLRCVVRLRDAIKAVAKRGACPESHWPYRQHPTALRARPPKKAFEAARNCKIIEYHRIPGGSLQPAIFLRHLKQCLADGCPFLFGVTLYESFETEKVKKNGIMPIPDTRHEENKGGHAVMAVGYDDRRQAVLVRNSWGTDWGLKGYFWMPYKIITNRRLAYDFWTVRGVTM
jgi:C1A family cysteine protease